jgi:RHS repeat-associated protein
LNDRISVKGVLGLNRTFNSFGELDSEQTQISGQNVYSYALKRDGGGSIQTRTETVNSFSIQNVYGYDSLGRLTSVMQNGVVVEEYQYGANGTRIYEVNSSRGISGRTLSYSEEDHLLTAGDATYQYDLDGLLTTKVSGSQVTQYAYSSRGELLGVALPDGRLIEYVTDPLGRRIAKKIDGIIVEKYLWQRMTGLLAVYDGNDALLMRFQYADARMPLAMSKGGINYYLAYDQVGSLRVVSDTLGNVVKEIDYDSFGNVLSDTNPNFTVPFGFAGGLYDPDTGLVHFGARDYDPDTGRWTAKDPIKFWGGDANLYGYVQNDPVNWIDPFGLWEAQGHADLTTDAAGYFPRFTQADINNMITANNNVDRISNQLNDPAHFMPGTRDQAQDLINRLLDRAVEMENCGRHEDAVDALGEGLHTIQDRFAHFEQNAGWVEHATGNPDNPTAHPLEYRNALNASVNYLRQFSARTLR